MAAAAGQRTALATVTAAAGTISEGAALEGDVQRQYGATEADGAAPASAVGLAGGAAADDAGSLGRSTDRGAVCVDGDQDVLAALPATTAGAAMAPITAKVTVSFHAGEGPDLIRGWHELRLPSRRSGLSLLQSRHSHVMLVPYPFLTNRWAGKTEEYVSSLGHVCPAHVWHVHLPTHNSPYGIPVVDKWESSLLHK